MMRVAILGSNPTLAWTWPSSDYTRCQFHTIIAVNYALHYERKAGILCAGDLDAYVNLGKSGVYPLERYHVMDHVHPENDSQTIGHRWAELQRTTWQSLPELFRAIPYGDGQVNPRNWSIQAAIDIAIALAKEAASQLYLELHGIRWSNPNAGAIDVSGYKCHSRTEERWGREHRDMQQTCTECDRLGIQVMVATADDRTGRIAVVPWGYAARYGHGQK